jgi:hypothetical protein
MIINDDAARGVLTLLERIATALEEHTDHLRGIDAGMGHIAHMLNVCPQDNHPFAVAMDGIASEIHTLTDTLEEMTSTKQQGGEQDYDGPQGYHNQNR